MHGTDKIVLMAVLLCGSMAGPGPRYWLAVSRLAEVSVQMADVTAHGYVGRAKGVDSFYRVFAPAATSPLVDGGLMLFWMTKMIAIASSGLCDSHANRVRRCVLAVVSQSGKVSWLCAGQRLRNLRGPGFRLSHSV